MLFTRGEVDDRKVFAGQPKHDGISYRIDPGRLKKAAQSFAVHADGGNISDDAGLRNAEIILSSAQRLVEVHCRGAVGRAPRGRKIRVL